MSIVAAGGLRSRYSNSRKPSGLNKLAIDQGMLSGSVDAGFVLALPFHHGDLWLCRSFEEGGLCAGSKYFHTCAKMQGGRLMCEY